MVLQRHAYGYVYANECFERKHGDNDAGNSPTRENSENGHSFTGGAMQFWSFIIHDHVSKFFFISFRSTIFLY